MLINHCTIFPNFAHSAKRTIQVFTLQAMQSSLHNLQPSIQFVSFFIVYIDGRRRRGFISDFFFGFAVLAYVERLIEIKIRVTFRRCSIANNIQVENRLKMLVWFSTIGTQVHQFRRQLKEFVTCRSKLFRVFWGKIM